MMKNITCPLCCNLGFSNRDDLKEHLQKATTSLNCPFCLVSCKNVTNLIKHLDVCSASGDTTSKGLPPSDSADNDLDNNPQLSDNDDDDVEGYFCTVCDIKIPDVYKHIQQFHHGQEVILQDDDEDSDGSKPSVPPPSSHSDTSGTKRKQEEVVNGSSLKNKKSKSDVRGEAGENETFYCPRCNVSFLSLTEHANKYHQKDEVLVQDVFITDLFTEMKKGLTSRSYSCSSCERTIPRPNMLSKHLRLSVINKPKTAIKTEGSFDREVDGVKLEPGTEFEIEEVKLDNYDFDDLGSSLFGIYGEQIVLVNSTSFD